MIMPTRKTSKKPARKAGKATKGKVLDLRAIKAGRMVLYGPPIRDAILRGKLAEMRQLAVAARAHVKDVQSALSALEAALKK
jgi:uncharacterized protein DUF1843